MADSHVDPKGHENNNKNYITKKNFRVSMSYKYRNYSSAENNKNISENAKNNNAV